MLVTASAGSDAAIWARSGIPIEGTCDGSMPAVSPPVKSPDKTTEVALQCKTLNRDDAEIALTVRHAGRVWEIALPMTVHWVITSSNECVDVITEREPTVDIL